MEIKEFVDAVNKLEKYYDKEYTPEQRKIMFDRLKNLNIKEFNRAVNYIIDNSKYLPRVADFKFALSQPNNLSINKTEIDFVKCNRCDCGFIQYFKDIKDGDKILKYPFIALCDCENGKKQKEINNYRLPFYREIFRN